MLNSIRTRLALWFTGILALVLIAFAVTAYFFLIYNVSRQTDRTLTDLSHSFIDLVESERDEKNGRRSVSEATFKAVLDSMEDMRFRNYQIFVYDAGNKLMLDEKAPHRNQELSSDQLQETFADFLTARDEVKFYDLFLDGRNFRVLAVTYPGKGQTFRIFISHSLNEEKALQGRFLRTLAISIPVALLLACFGGYFLARKTLAPVVTMSDSAAQISATNLHERLPVKNEKDELGNLATVFNSLLERLENSFEQQRRFMADASHELRTPLAIVRGESEVALSKDDRPVNDYRESLEIVNDESKRLTKIVENLFTLARADAGQYKTHFAPLYLDELAGEAVRSMRVLADQKQITLEFSAPDEMPFHGDVSLLHRLFLNLIDNAVKYDPVGGTVSVTCHITNDKYRIDVTDNGPGIPLGEQVKIFERFYRIDKARSRGDETANSGAGLGLSIASWIAGLHSGTIKVSSNENGGSIFTVELPREPRNNGEA